jgi:hypothetical protein
MLRRLQRTTDRAALANLRALRPPLDEGGRNSGADGAAKTAVGLLPSVPDSELAEVLQRNQRSILGIAQGQ